MTVLDAIFLAACFFLFLIPLYFVMHKVYEDGLIGRIGLLGISFSAAAFILSWMDNSDWPVFPYELAPQDVMMVVAFAVFLVWHLLRFHRRVVMQKKIKA